jgi:alpha-D-xyloside xylohydrolase
MQRFSAFLAVLFGIVFTAASVAAQAPSQRLELKLWHETIVLEPYAPNVLRVTLSLNHDPAVAAPGYGVTAAPKAEGWNSSETPLAYTYKSDRIVASVERP